MKVGDSVWIFDENSRKYANPEKGRMWGPLIFRSHYRKTFIDSETSRSWILSWVGVKIPKLDETKAPKDRKCRVFFSEEEVDDDVLLRTHRYTIASEIQNMRCPKTLRQIADLIGYTKHKHPPAADSAEES